MVRVQQPAGSAWRLVQGRSGTTTALVGSSGSGKSTLISIVMAFNRPTSGRVLVDGRDLEDVKLTDYREQLASVLQDNFLFDGDRGKRRICQARGHAGRDRAGVPLAHCDEFINGFPDGYATVVGERGIKLSGGQRQRVSIARAILANPRILILDEATSSLDSESEQMIQDGLRRLRSGRTTFVIAHRLSTIRAPTRFWCSKRERSSSGTHVELLALNGRYRQLHDKQCGSRRIGSSIRAKTSPRSRKSPRCPRRASARHSKQQFTDLRIYALTDCDWFSARFRRSKSVNSSIRKSVNLGCSRMMHDVDFRIVGNEMQFIEVELDPGESAVAEAGSMMYTCRLRSRWKRCSATEASSVRA